MTPQDFRDAFEDDFREELADIAGPPQSSGDRRLLELTRARGDLIPMLEKALAEAAFQRARADETREGEQNMDGEIVSAMGATRNVSMHDLPPILSAVRSWISRQPGVAHVEMVARMWASPTARVTLTDGSHLVATAFEAVVYPAGRAPWLPELDAEFRLAQKQASESWRSHSRAAR